MAMKKIFVKPHYPENLSKLLKLTDNLWWTWNYDAVNLFYRINAPLFRELRHNPIKLLYLVPKEKIHKLSQDKGFLFELEKVWQQYEEYLKQSETLKKENAKKYGFGSNNKESIAYFLMEFGVHESLPTYAGGLGILSGDFIKSASDTGIPIIGIGILYKYGYFTQRLNPDGKQEEIFIEFENYFEPLKEAQNQQKQPLYIETYVLGEKTKVKVWQTNVGTARLILLDTDIPENPSHLRDITHELYVADKEKRIQQELVLGKGGIDALNALGIKPKIYHLNEGHSAFLIVRRLQQLILEEKLSFAEARAIIRSSTVFTTHTPLIEGNENFKTDLARKYLDIELHALAISLDEFAKLAFVENKTDTFWLPALAIRFSDFNNAVSLQHKDVSREIWKALFPTRPKAEIPIDHVTNGVHSSWISESFTNILKRYLGKNISDIEDEPVLKRILDIPDEEIWEAHLKNKKILVPFVRKIISDAFVAKGYSLEKSHKLSSLLNPTYLTIGFARRFAAYKRPTLILNNKKRLTKILTNSDRPVQLIFSGKAHPADERGKEMIKEIMDYAKEYEVEDRVIFLENYDIDIARHLVWGVDIWLNNPQEEMEASGTSGIKAAMNGVLNLSTLEGWWKEGYNGRNGWAITVGKAYKDPELKEAAEANQIYELLEEEITQHYYERNKKELPEKWIKIMKESIKSVLWKFNMYRALYEYVDKFYVNSLKESDRIRSHNYKVLKEAVAEEKVVLQHWNEVNFIDFSVNIDQDEQ
ncbi:MAG: alpha-glucan family phosphorylase, partial [Candidatus Ratteibacteria bacterium]|nr:alpha-glucan family phosphorylase [Candidatus Ratteibacteria bacterium]